MLLLALHVTTSPSFALDIVIVLTLSYLLIDVPFRIQSHLMVIGGVPLALQSTVTLYLSKTYTGDPILTVLFPFVMIFGLGISGPLSIHGGSSKRNKKMRIHKFLTL